MSETKKTLVLGASAKLGRTSGEAIHRLREAGHEVVAVGMREESVGDVSIQTGKPHVENLHTVTLYINPEIQADYRDYLFSLRPQRILFNPGTENPELMKEAAEKGIRGEEACTLVLLSLNSY